jgi:hypothetical protein
LLAGVAAVIAIFALIIWQTRWWWPLRESRNSVLRDALVVERPRRTARGP